MSRIAIALVLLWLLPTPCAAQWFPWGDNSFVQQGPSSVSPGERREQRNRHPRASQSDGGKRPDIRPQAPPKVAFPYSFSVGSIVIDSSSRKLYYVLEGKPKEARQGIGTPYASSQ